MKLFKNFVNHRNLVNLDNFRVFAVKACSAYHGVGPGGTHGVARFRCAGRGGAGSPRCVTRTLVSSFSQRDASARNVAQRGGARQRPVPSGRTHTDAHTRTCSRPARPARLRGPNRWQREPRPAPPRVEGGARLALAWRSLGAVGLLGWATRNLSGCRVGSGRGPPASAFVPDHAALRRLGAPSPAVL